MRSVELRYCIRVSDYREAVYYVLFLRKKTGFRIAAGVLLVSFVYAVLCFHGVAAAEPAIWIIPAVCLIWVLLQLAEAERDILRYTRSADSLIGVRYESTFSAERFSISIPEKSFSISGKTSDFTCAFEIAHCFLLYATDRQLFIVPTRDMKKEEASALHAVLSKSLGKNFYSLFRRRAA